MTQFIVSPKHTISDLFQVKNLRFVLSAGSTVYNGTTNLSDVDYIAVFDGEYIETEDPLLDKVNLVKRIHSSDKQIVTYMYGKLYEDQKIMVEYISFDDLKKLTTINFNQDVAETIKITKVFFGEAIIYDQVSSRNISGVAREYKRNRIEFSQEIIGMQGDFYYSFRKDFYLSMFLDKLLISLIPYYYAEDEKSKLVRSLIGNLSERLYVDLNRNQIEPNKYNAFYKIFYSYPKFRDEFQLFINELFLESCK